MTKGFDSNQTGRDGDDPRRRTLLGIGGSMRLPAPNPDVIYRAVDGGAALLCTKKGYAVRILPITS